MADFGKQKQLQDNLLVTHILLILIIIEKIYYEKMLLLTCVWVFTLIKEIIVCFCKRYLQQVGKVRNTGFKFKRRSDFQSGLMQVVHHGS